jgi:hypothetical protein
MMKLLALIAALTVAANCAAITWTGYGNDNQWYNTLNWNPDQIPGANDDVTIAAGVVQVTRPTGVSSIIFGTTYGQTANLTIFDSFFVGNGGMTVQGGGNLFLNAGTAALSGSVTINGKLFFQSGSLSGTITASNTAVVDMSGAAEKTFTACAFTSQAQSFVFSGVMALNQSSQVVVQSTAVFSGDVSIQAQDTTAVLLDTSAGTLTYTGAGTLQIMAPFNVGTFNFESGNLTVYSDVTFVNPFVIPSGSYVASVGTAVLTMSGSVSGAGVLSAAGTHLILNGINMTGYLNLVGGNISFGTGANSIGVFTVSGGFAKINNAVSVAQLNFMSGNVMGGATLTAAKLYFSSQGFNLNAAVVVTGTASVGGLMAFGPAGSFKVSSTGTFNTLASVTFTGVPGMTVTNNGAFNVKSSVTFQNINLAGTGSVSAQGVLMLQTASVSQSAVALSGSGVFKGSNTRIIGVAKVTASPKVKATIGAYSFTCPGECDSVTTNGVPTSSFTFSS